MALRGEHTFPTAELATNSQHNIAQQESSDTGENALRSGKRIIVENARQFLEYNAEFGVLICSHARCQYAVRNLENHLRTSHSSSAKDRRDVIELFRHCQLRDPSTVPLPAPLGKPFATLRKPRRAFICEEPECEEISINRDGIRKHCNKAHNWRSSKAKDTLWHRVWVQTFFTAGGLQKYFTVDYNEVETQENGNEDRPSTADRHRIPVVLEEWDRAIDKHQQELETADAKVAKTDHTLWFKRNGWPEHLAKSNLRHLSRAIRIPDRDEAVLQQAVELVGVLIERAVSGLSTLDDEVRRWLRSAKQSEPDVRPLGRLQNDESQARYAGYMKKCICYILRVYQSAENQARSRESGATGSDSDSDSGPDGETSEFEVSDDEDSAGSSERSAGRTDVLNDARRLFPWHGCLKERVGRLWQALEQSQGQEEQTQALQDVFKTLIFRHVRGDVFQSALLHFLAVLGIDEETGRLRQANDFSYMLAGVVYCVRVLGVEIILPSAERDHQGDEDDKRFRKQRDKYLSDGSFSVMSKMLSLLAYGKNLALNHGNAGSVFWSKDGRTMSIQGKSITIGRFRKMVQESIGDAENLLWRDLMWSTDAQRFEVPLDELEDNVTWTKRGVSFLNNAHNKLEDKREWMLKRVLSHDAGGKMFVGGQWVRRRVRAYLREAIKFLELVLFCIHLTYGQPARGSEITTIRFRNGFLQDRNVFALHGLIAIVVRYHKSQSQYDKPKVIPRFLPWRVGQLLTVYLAYVQPFYEYLSVQVKGAGWSDHVWAGEQGPWETDRLTRIISRETEKRLGVRLTTHDYRHTAISIGRRVVGEQFAHGYAEGMADIEEAEMETDDVLEMSAGRTGEIGANRYGVSVDVIKHLSSRSVDVFRPLSEKWHEFLGLSSYSEKGQKRTREERSNSTYTEEEQVQSDRRMAITLENNGLHNWETAIARYTQVTPVSKRSDSTWWFGQSSQAAPSLGSEDESTERKITAAVQKVLGREDFSFKSSEQKEALYAIVGGAQKTPLVVVLPTGGGKSLLFMAPACLEDPGVTIVVVPFRALINNLVATARKCGIDCIEHRPGEVNPAALVFVSADFVAFGGFLSYARLLESQGLLRRIFVDECHLTFTASDWRPKLAEVRAVRGLRCPTILLTATLPILLEFELEAGMAAQMARYIRAVTTRTRTRYVVHACKAGTVEDEAIAVCRRMQQHLGWRKGVVYSRSRDQCERVARELECAYYHAGAVDNEERLQVWLSGGGLIVATSALGTGVDYPGIVFVMHIDLPYGMIDFAQESGRAGRAGEDVDSVIVIAENRVEQLSGKMRGVDDSTMGQFVTTKGCRRAIKSLYLDGRAIECGDGDGDMARCDRCGEGLSALERAYRRAAQEREMVEEQLDRVVDGCAACWVMLKPWDHAAVTCTQRGGAQESEYERLRECIRYESSSHSCHRCGISQRMYATGKDSKARCQWPKVMAPILQRLQESRDGAAALKRIGFDGEMRERAEYGRWLGMRHRRRIWGEVMSNAMAVLIDVVVQRKAEEGQRKGAGEKEVGVELERQLTEWQKRCAICVVQERGKQGHAEWRECPWSEEERRVVEQAWQALEEVEFEEGGQCGRCWAPEEVCRRGEGKCRFAGVARDAGAALLGLQADRVGDWIDGEAAKAGLEVMEEESEWRVWAEWLGKVGEVEGVMMNGVCQLVRAVKVV